jgi:hypothetical protein
MVEYVQLQRHRESAMTVVLKCCTVRLVGLKFYAFFSLALMLPWASWAMPLETIPSWMSNPNSHVATGGAWHDLDGDGWLDLIAANGNDIFRQSVVVYHNNGDGTLPLNPTWSADDIDYHGHLDLGDINGDGFVDLAVAVYLGPGGFGYPGGAKVYFGNESGTFNNFPNWFPAETFYCFSVAFGDADGDGDLDLACACGDDYYDEPERQRIFFNNGGTLESTPSWESDEIAYALDVTWGDIDGDGCMDVAFCGTSSPNRLYVNDPTSGLPTTASWENTDLPQYGNTAAFGDWNNDGFPELAVADNDQLGGPGRFKVYGNIAGELGTTPAWHSSSGGYGSNVSWIDLDLDSDLDLAGGRWFDAARIYENSGGTLASAPVWISETESVIENMFWGDVDNDGLHSDGVTMTSGDGVRTFFYLGHSPVRSVDEVLVDGNPMTNYVDHAGNGWIVMTSPPAEGESLEIYYTYSTDLDLGVTNWDTNEGNYLFLNTGASDVPDIASAVAGMRVYPNPVSARARIRYRGEGVPEARLAVYDVSGRLVKSIHHGPLPEGLRIWEWDRRDDMGRRVSGGVYFARISTSTENHLLKLVLLD